MSIARTVEVTADFGNNIIEANAEIANRSIEAEAGMSTTIEHIYVEGGALPQGGIPGDILMKRTSTDYDAEWVARQHQQSRIIPVPSQPGRFTPRLATSMSYCRPYRSEES